GEAKNIVVFEVSPHTFEPAAGQSVFAGFYKRHTPRICEALMDRNLAVLHVDRHIGYVQFIVKEIILDEIAFVSYTNNEIVDTVKRIDLHDVPENWTIADLDHRFWSDLGFFG